VAVGAVSGAAEIVPLTLAQARRYIAEHHRHNEPPIGLHWPYLRPGEAAGLIVVGLVALGALGVGVVGLLWLRR
jgi:hypothetical protein